MTASEYVVEVLGGPSVFKGRAVPTSTELRERIRQGLPYRSLESVRERLRLSVPEAADVLHMPTRTMARRRQARPRRPFHSSGFLEASTRCPALKRVAATLIRDVGFDPVDGGALRVARYLEPFALLMANPIGG
jgi:predicted dinucleotide-binding enzyme